MNERELTGKVLDLLIYGSSSKYRYRCLGSSTGGWSYEMMALDLKVSKSEIIPVIVKLCEMGKVRKYGCYFFYEAPKEKLSKRILDFLIYAGFSDDDIVYRAEGWDFYELSVLLQERPSEVLSELNRLVGIGKAEEKDGLFSYKTLNPRKRKKVDRKREET